MGYLEENNLEGFEYPPEVKIDMLRPYVRRILLATGYDLEEVFITDESIIWDFAGDGFDYSQMKSEFGIEITEHDYVWEAAARLKEASPITDIIFE